MAAQASTLQGLAPIPRLRASLRASGLFHDGTIVLARAPGRLDVMGGIADYSGALVCQMSLAVAAGVAVQERDDGCMICCSAQLGRKVTMPIANLRRADPSQVQAMLHGEDKWARYAIGCVWLVLQYRELVKRKNGIALLIDSDVPLGGGVSSSAAVEVAAMTALCSLLGVSMTPLSLAVNCQTVENLVVGAPCGVMDQVASCLGYDGALIKIRCQGDDLKRSPVQVVGTLPIPQGHSFVGVFSGVSHDVSGDPYTDTRVAAFMGQKILSQVNSQDITCGYLANVDAERFSREWSAQVPELLRGSDFLSRFGFTNDDVTKVDPNKDYHVRAATTHHVLESQRVRDFIRFLEAEQVKEAGALMNQSHRSYSEYANLGHPMTDKLVEMAMEAGALGAKITGGGCGGTVAMLIRDDAPSRDAIEKLRGRYTCDTGRPTLYFDGTSPGAAATGAQAIQFKDLP